MIQGKVSVIIPSRKERWLQQTVDDLLSHAEDEIEVIAVHDGAWPDVPLKDHPRLVQLHTSDNRGMRAAINAGVRIATGEYILKSDGHCSFAGGFDRTLKDDCDDNWVVVPRRYRLDADNWCNIEDGRPPVDYHYLSYPFARPDDSDCSMHGQIWSERAKERQGILFDEEMSSQGSSWFCKREYFNRLISPLDDVNYFSFYHEMQEIGLKVWLSGGKMMVNKKTWYSHLFKGKKHGTGYQFTNDKWKQWAKEAAMAKAFTVDWWLNDRWSERTRDFSWLIEKFNPPGWPENWQEVARQYSLGPDRLLRKIA